MVRWLQKLLRVGLVLIVLLLTGCLQYDLELQFDSQTHGQLVQQLRWRGGAIAANDELQQWLTVLSERTQQLGGRTRWLSDNAFEIVIPFSNGRALETKFNQFFSPNDATTFTLPAGEPIRAELTLQQGNRFVAIYNHLKLQVDLTAVPDLAATGLPLLQGQQLLAGQVTLLAPWVRWQSLSPGESPAGAFTPQETWSLVPGEVNELEAEFWVPSPIGIGAVTILVFVLLGYGVKYGLASR
ncbi:MAG: DUF3153 domain-containing protein [Cyanobacteria bacterium P01_D01_bin.128]